MATACTPSPCSKTRRAPCSTVCASAPSPTSATAKAPIRNVRRGPDNVRHREPQRREEREQPGRYEGPVGVRIHERPDLRRERSLLRRGVAAVVGEHGGCRTADVQPRRGVPQRLPIRRQEARQIDGACREEQRDREMHDQRVQVRRPRGDERHAVLYYGGNASTSCTRLRTCSTIVRLPGRRARPYGHVGSLPARLLRRKLRALPILRGRAR